MWLLLLAVVAAAGADPPVCWHTAATRLQSLLLSSTHQSRPLSLVGCRGTYAELAAAGVPEVIATLGEATSLGCSADCSLDGTQALQC